MPASDIDKLLKKSIVTTSKDAKDAKRLLYRKNSDINPPHSDTDLEDGTTTKQESTSPTSLQEAHRPVMPRDEVPDEADGFDWIEEEFTGNDLTDGMAALSINPKGTGYFGLASSSVLLRALKNWDPSGSPQYQTDPGDILDDEQDVDFFHENEIQYQIASQLSGVHPYSKLVTDSLVDAFFTFYNSSYPLIHEPTFRLQYQNLAPRPREDVWGLLYNTILALGSWCINPENSSADLIYYNNARSRFRSNITEMGNLALVQALTLLSNYVQKRNKPNTGWNYLGIAIRMALGLGLHKEFPNWTKSPLKVEMRRRVWWILYIFDAGAAVTFGRPINLPGPEIVDAKLPLNTHDTLFTSETTIDMLKSSEITVTGPTLYSGIIAQTKFCLITNGIYNRLLSNPSPSAEESLEFNKTILTEFIDNLPDYFKQEDRQLNPACQWLVLTKYRLLWRVKNFQVIMFRPFVLQRILQLGSSTSQLSTSEPEQACRQICVSAARDTIHLVDEFLHMNPGQTAVATWYALYFLFQSVLIPIISLSSEPTSEHAPDWIQDVEKTKRILLSLCDQNKLAKRFYDVIDNLSNHYSRHPGDPHEWMSDIYSMVFDVPGAIPTVFPEDYNPVNETVIM